MSFWPGEEFLFFATECYCIGLTDFAHTGYNNFPLKKLVNFFTFWGFGVLWCSQSKKTTTTGQLIIISLCCIIAKYWLESFCQIVLFQLAQVLYFILELTGWRPRWSELMHLSFGVNIAIIIHNAFFTQNWKCIRSDQWGLWSVSYKKKYKTWKKSSRGKDWIQELVII